MDEILDDKKTYGTSDQVLIDKHIAVFPFQGIDIVRLIEEVQVLFAERKYKCTQTAGTEFVFTQGSQIARVLVGAFAKFYKWTVRIEKIESLTRLTLIKEERGHLGGLFGVGQVKREYQVLTDLLVDLHNRLNNPH